MRNQLVPVLMSMVVVGRTATAQPVEEPAPKQSADLYAPAPTPVPPADVRGWERPPTETPGVFGVIGRGVGAVVGLPMDLMAVPVHGALWLEDHHRAFSRTRDLFYNADHTAGVVPSLTLESGFGAAFGANAFHNNVLGNHERISLSGTYGGEDRYSTQVKVELPGVLDRVYLKSRARYEVSDNELFAGIGNAMDGGPLAPNGSTRYGEKRTLATGSAGVRLGALRIGGTYIYNDREFDPGVASSITERYDPALLEGFGTGIRLHEATADVELDLRDRRGTTGSGIRIAGFGGRGFGDSYGFTHWGGEVAAYITPWQKGRVFVVRVAHEGVDGDVPFTELPRLGGPGLLRGYRRDQFRDELSTIGTVEYRYPIHQAISGALFVETGKVANTYDALAGFDNWHLGYGGGLIIHGRDRIAVTIQLAYGDGLQFFASTDVLQAFRNRSKEL